VLAHAVLGAVSTDVCEQKVPASLTRALNTKFPGFRLPRLGDQDRYGTDFNKHAGGDGCITVAMGDFDGDGQKDIAVLLTSRKSKAARLVVGLRRAASWTIDRLPTWCGTTDRCYVETAKPALFKRAGELDSPLSSGEREQIKSQTENVLSGTVESTGIVYVYSKGTWQYVRVSD
jgi:hypothetical protein